MTDFHAAARPFAEVQQQVAELLNDRMLVGHAVHNDLKVNLTISHVYVVMADIIKKTIGTPVIPSATTDTRHTSVCVQAQSYEKPMARVAAPRAARARCYDSSW